MSSCLIHCFFYCLVVCTKDCVIVVITVTHTPFCVCFETMNESCFLANWSHSRSREKHLPVGRVSPYTFMFSALPCMFYKRTKYCLGFFYLLIIDNNT